jgi:predicted pyridoxine 5'-phosphate oxidase superfamily flavin-nucleotide-binding protein
VSAVHPDLVTPTGVAEPALLALEMADPPVATLPDPTPVPPPPMVEQPTVKLHPIGAVTQVMGPIAPPARNGYHPACGGERLLQNAYGTRDRAERFYRDQVLDRLNPEMIEFVGRMEMAFIGTADAGGECDSSLRAGSPGFLHVLDERRITYPEYRGNGVLASLGNISENPHVALLMIDFVRDLIGLHVNGRAAIVEDAVLRQERPDLPAAVERGRTPERWVVVQVEEAYLHCRKHIPRMQPVSREREWGTDDVRRKGGDYFGVRARQSTPAAGLR